MYPPGIDILFSEDIVHIMDHVCVTAKIIIGNSFEWIILQVIRYSSPVIAQVIT